MRADQIAFTTGEERHPRGPFVETRSLANWQRLDPVGRVALVAIMALYDEDDTDRCSRGRGRVLTARDLGDYLRNRAESRPAAFEALLMAMAAYHGC